MYYHTKGLNFSGCHGSSGSRYASPFVNPEPHRWYMPPVKITGATKKTQNDWMQPEKKKKKKKKNKTKKKKKKKINKLIYLYLIFILNFLFYTLIY